MQSEAALSVVIDQEPHSPLTSKIWSLFPCLLCNHLPTFLFNQPFFTGSQQTFSAQAADSEITEMERDRVATSRPRTDSGSSVKSNSKSDLESVSS